MEDRPEQWSLLFSSEGQGLYPSHLLPTDSKIAASGVAEYQRVIDALPPTAQKIFLEDKNIRACFIGCCPEYGGTSWPEFFNLLEANQQAIREVLANSTSMLLVDHPNSNGDARVSLINLGAAKRVIQNYQDFFPPLGRQDIRTWLVNNPQEWCFYSINSPKLRKDPVAGRIVQLRYGLLSGYPFDACFKHWSFQAAGRKIQKVLSGKDRDFFLWYLENSQTAEAGQKLKMEQLLSQAGLDLTEEEKSLVVNGAKKGGLFGGILFFGFDEEADRQYLEDLQQIYVESGINDVAKSML